MVAGADVIDAFMRRAPGLRTLVLAAHPDDEVLWLGATMADRDLTLVHLTDGAPRDAWFAASAGCDGDEAYAALRASELSAALAEIGLARAPRVMLGARDQESPYELERLARALADIIASTRADAVIAQAYDGGHPDHDAAAFVARAAVALATRRGIASEPALLDMAGYHAAEGRFGTGFLPRRENAHARELVLSPAQLTRKQRALACFRSQRDVLARIESSIERLRPGAREDFTRAPHPGRLHYEAHGWPIDGERFRGLAAGAARALRLPSVLP